jgi:hypothetical protein
LDLVGVHSFYDDNAVLLPELIDGASSGNGRDLKAGHFKG